MKFTTKNSLKIAAIAFLGLVSEVSFGQQEGQNLVPNASFESTGKKPKKLGSIESATGWVSPTGVRADLYANSNNPDVNVPLNINGKEEAKDGANYAGIVAYSHGNKEPRSYVMTKLEAPLKKGMRYCVKFNVSLSESSKYAVNNLGAKLSKKPYGTDSKVPIIAEPSLQHFNNDHKIMTARYGWTEICGVYTADGGEKFITLGNFNSDEETKNERMKKDNNIKVTQLIAAYYYLDDVSVSLLGKDESCECEAEDSGEEFSTLIYQKTFNVTEEMTPSEKMELQQVFFAFGRKKLTPEGKESLDLIAEQLKANPTLKIEINGHNNAAEDSVGVENDYYADMDNKRIGVVMEYLKEKGIASNQMMFARKGTNIDSDEIVESDDAELKMAKNRRVSFKVR